MPTPNSKNRPYKYQSQDDPTRLAQQYGITPQALIQANPGGTPFSTGQVINLPVSTTPLFPVGNQPYNYFQNQNANKSPLGSILSAYGQSVTPGQQQAMGNNLNLYNQGALNTPVQGVTPRPPAQPTPNNYNTQQRGRGFQVNPYETAQAGIQQALTNEIANAMSSGTQPSTLSPAAAASLGINPTQAGYLMQNGQWVYNAEYAAQLGVDQQQGTDTTGGGGGEQSYNPRDIAYTWNKYAKNPKSRFETNLKWAQNAWRRKRQQAKGNRTQGKDVANANAAAQQNNSITGFGLVNFSASSG